MLLDNNKEKNIYKQKNKMTQKNLKKLAKNDLLQIFFFSKY